ncbi:MAG: tight adherence protein C, partial [Psychromonas sp.]
MDYILALINSFVKNPQTAEWIFYLIAATAGVTFAISLSLLFSGIYSPVKSKLHKIANEGEPEFNGSFNKSLEHTLGKLPFIERQFSGDEQTRRLLIHAGFHSQNSLKIYNSLK